MFRRFGKKKKEPDPKPATYDEEYDDDFGYEREATQSGKRKPPRPPAEPSFVDEPFTEEPAVRSNPPQGRDSDEATIVTRPPGPDSGSPAEGLSPPTDEVDLADATQFIGALPDAAARVVGWLVSTRGPSRGRDTRLGRGRTRVGTSRECEICLVGDEFASTLHAEVSLEGEDFVLRDLGSTNGTFRNEERIKEVHLRDGDQIRFGTSHFVYKGVRL